MSHESWRVEAEDLSISQPHTVRSPAPEATKSITHNRSLLRRIFPWLLRSLGLLVLVAMGVLGVDIIGGLELMLDARPEYLVPAFAIFCLSLLVRMVIWVILARSLQLGYRRLRSYVRLFFIGWSAALGLPVGAAPLARVAVLASDKRSVGRGVIIDIAGRLFEVAGILVLLMAGATYLSAESTHVLLGLGVGSAILAVASLPVIAGAWLFRPRLRRLLSQRWIEPFARDIGTALTELRHLRPSLLFGLFSLVMAAFMLIITSLFLASRALDVPLSYPTLMAAFAAVSLTTLIPISINGLGPREGIFAAAVAGAGFDSEAGVALGLLWFVMQAATRLAAAASWFMNSAEDENGAATIKESETEPP